MIYAKLGGGGNRGCSNQNKWWQNAPVHDNYKGMRPFDTVAKTQSGDKLFVCEWMVVTEIDTSKKLIKYTSRTLRNSAADEIEYQGAFYKERSGEIHLVYKNGSYPEYLIILPDGERLFMPMGGMHGYVYKAFYKANEGDRFKGYNGTHCIKMTDAEITTALSKITLNQ